MAVLDKYVRLSPTRPNFVDAATATIQADIEADLSTLRDIGVLKGVGPDVDQLGGAVVKVGRTTGVTRGLITAFELDNVIVGYDMGNLRFDNQIEIEGAESGPFSQGGDSGSLIVDEDGGAVALLFAGGDTGGSNGMGLTYGNPIPRVLDALTVELAI